MYGDDLKIGDLIDWRFKKKRGIGTFETGYVIEKRHNGLMVVREHGNKKTVVVDPAEIEYRKV